MNEPISFGHVGLLSREAQMPPTAETSRRLPAEIAEQPALMQVLVLLAIFGCAGRAASILIADSGVPDHDRIADSISDLGAGRYEVIVDTGLYAFSAALISRDDGSSCPSSRVRSHWFPLGGVSHGLTIER